MPEIAQLAPGRLILTRRYHFYAHRTVRVLECDIPRGFPFDGASIPPLAWPIVGHPLERALVASIRHDWGYYTHAPDDRELWDEAFYYDLLWTGHDAATAYAMWRAVRLGAAGEWRRGADMIARGRRVADPVALGHHADSMLVQPWRAH